MKYIAIISLLGALTFSSCNKTLQEDPNGQLTGAGAVNSVPGLQAAVLGAYQPLKNGYTSGFASSAIVAVLMGSDDLTTHPASNKQELREMDQFAVNSTNGRCNVIWLGCYKAIQNANNVINNYTKVNGDPAVINPLAGEAYFIRAFSYYWLVRLWGNIPLITTADYSADLLTVKKSTPQDVYKLIESDLQQAEKLMPNTKAAPGRASAGTAKALLADVYLTEGGWPIKDASKYALAAAKAKEVIDNKGAYGFDLVPDLAQLWSGTPASIGTAEEVFAFQFCASCGNGNSVYGKSSMPSDEGGWDDYFTEVNFYNNFPAGKRKDVTFYTSFKTSGGMISWKNGATKHPYYNKFRINTPTPGYLTSSTNMSIPIIRYAHVLLIFAEAQARAAAPSPDAYAAVNKVRARAGLPDLANMSATDFANAVVQERSWEFAGEYTRWFDLQRLEQVESANANKDASDLPPLRPISKTSYWLPIPYGDAQLNPGIK
ncbi:RagB/SusD family nutrient uptake outer membrane protein [Chitinophaga vietnamensis]|uniref:RagB/SusD family nutrient uptake outer membrane protein n=1 Tax=Chitinophaga vietnamensis TaxID=2593957 RepID=UPI0011775D74|nr:RagB/SusD family nutrient uptake outer membrane protein [Chitinophaga vietnamensis]